MSGSTDFNNFSCTTPGKSILFSDNALDTQTIGGTFTITGSPIGLVHLESMTSGNPWRLNPPAADSSVSYAYLKDGDITNGNDVPASRITNAGGNDVSTGDLDGAWQILSAVYTWTGASNTDWTDQSNWNDGLSGYPSLATDSVIIPAAASYPDLSTDPLNPVDPSIQDLVIQNAAELGIGDNSLTISGTFENRGTLKRSGMVGATDGKVNKTDTDSGTVEYTSAGIIQDYGSQDYFNLVIDQAAELAYSTDVNGSFTVNASGSLNPQSKLITVGGDWTSNVVAPGPVLLSGTVVFDDSSKTTHVTGSTTFYNLSCLTPGKTIKFSAAGADTQAIGRMVSVSGTTGAPVRLESAASPGKWQIAPSNSTGTVSYVYLQDGDITSGFNISVSLSVDGGGNDTVVDADGAWLFGGKAYTWRNDAASTSWADPNNWTVSDGSSGYPSQSVSDDAVTIPSGGIRYPVLSSDVTLEDLTIEYGASLDIAVRTLTINGSYENQGTLKRVGMVLAADNKMNVSDTDSGTVEYTAAGYVQEYGAVDYYRLSVSAGALTLSGNLSTAENLVVSGGLLSVGGQTLNVSGSLAVSGSGGVSVTTGSVSLARDWSVTAGASFDAGLSTVTFAGTANQALASGGADVNHDFNNLIINKTAGTVTTAAANAIAVAGNFSVSAGTFNSAANGTAVEAAGNLVVNGSVSSGSALFQVGGNASGSGGWSVTGDGADADVGGSFTVAGFTLVSGEITIGGNTTFTTLSQTGGTVILDGSAAQTLTTAGQQFVNLSLSGTNTVTPSGALKVSGTLDVAAGATLSLAGNTVNVAALTNAGTLTLDTSGGGSLAFGSFGSSGTVSVAGVSTIGVPGAFTNTGTLTLSAATALSVGGDAALGSAGAGWGNLALSMSGNPASLSAGQPFGSLSTTGTASVSLGSALSLSGSLTVGSGMTLTTGVNGLSSASLVCDGILNAGAQTAAFSVTGAAANSTANPANGGTITFGSGTVTLGSLTIGTARFGAGTGDVGGTLSVVTLRPSSTGLRVGGDFTVTTVEANGGTIEFYANGGTTVAANAQTLPAVSITSTRSLSADVTMGSLSIDGGGLSTGSNTLTVNGSVDIKAGTSLTVGTGTVKVGGGWTLAATGSFTAGTGTVQFTAGASPVDISGSSTFHNLHILSDAGGKTLRFTAGSMQTVTNELRIEGTAGNLVSLVSASGGSPWTLDYTGSAPGTNVVYAHLRDSSLTTGTISAVTSRDDGGNSGWDFNSTMLTWTGTTSTAWAVGSNWDIGYEPNTGDDALIPNVVNDPVLGETTQIRGLTIQSGGILSVNGQSLTIGGNLQLTGTLNASAAGSAITAQGDWTVASGGAVSVGPSTVTFSGGADQTLSNGNSDAVADFYHLMVNKTAGTVTVSGNAFDVDGDLTVTSGSLDVQTNNIGITIDGNLQIAGSFSSGTAAVAVGLNTGGAGSWTITGDGADADISGNFSVGTFSLLNAPSQIAGILIAGDAAFTNLTQDNGSLVALDGSGAQLLTTNDKAFRNLGLSGTGTVTVAGALTVNETFSTGAGKTLDLSGNTVNVAALTNAGTLTLDTSGGGSLAFGSFGSSGTVTVAGVSMIGVSGAFTNTGTLTLSAATALSVGGDAALGSAGTGWANLALSMSGNPASLSAGQPFGSLSTTGTASVSLGSALTVGSVTLGDTTALSAGNYLLTVNGALSDGAGSAGLSTGTGGAAITGNVDVTTFNAGPAEVAVGGDWSVGTFTAGGGTVRFNGTAGSTVAATSAFNNVIVSADTALGGSWGIGELSRSTPRRFFPPEPGTSISRVPGTAPRERSRPEAEQ